MKGRKANLKALIVLLSLFMTSFSSCDTVGSCWVCEDPNDSSDWQEVCNSMSKNKLESYGYICTQD
jgi:hypothetical protein